MKQDWFKEENSRVGVIQVARPFDGIGAYTTSTAVQTTCTVLRLRNTVLKLVYLVRNIADLKPILQSEKFINAEAMFEV